MKTADKTANSKTFLKTDSSQIPKHSSSGNLSPSSNRPKRTSAPLAPYTTDGPLRTGVRMIEALFNNYYVIAECQRAFTWDRKEVKDLFNSVVKNNGEDYAFGGITLLEYNDELHIMDGQSLGLLIKIN